MRKSDKTKNIIKANLLTEQRFVEVNSLTRINEGDEELNKLRDNLSHFYEYSKGNSNMLKGIEDKYQFWFPQNGNVEATMDRQQLTISDIQKSGNMFLGQNDSLFYFPPASGGVVSKNLNPNQVLNVFNKQFNTQFKNFKFQF
jgi:hypothetical protein